MYPIFFNFLNELKNYLTTTEKLTLEKLFNNGFKEELINFLSTIKNVSLILFFKENINKQGYSTIENLINEIKDIVHGF